MVSARFYTQEFDMANGFLGKIKRWFSKPANQRKAKRTARKAYRKYKNKDGR